MIQIESPTQEAAIAPEHSTGNPFLRRWLTFPAAIGFLLFLVVFVGNTEKRILEPDIWWHLRNADYIVANHVFPSVDQYSFTATGSPWVDHEWLSELVYFAAFRAAGLRGIMALYFALSAGIFLSLYFLCNRGGANPKTTSIVMSLGILMGGVSFGPRMLLFGWLFLVWLLLILQEIELRGDAPLWLLPPLFALWINFHGSWVFGFVILGAYIVSGLVRGRWGMVRAELMPKRTLKRILIVSGVSAVALFINPFFYKLPAYPFDLLFRQQTNLKNIAEWHSVDFQHPQGRYAMALLLLIFITLLVSRRPVRLREALLGLFAIYTGYTHWRMQFFASIIFVPMLAARLPLFPPYEPEKEKPLLNGIIIAAVLLFIVIRFPSEKKLEETVYIEYPHAALQYMRDHGINDRIFNEYGWGGYIILYAPEIKTFIDGRADIFVYKGVFDDYQKAAQLEGTLAILDRYRIHYVLLEDKAAMGYLLTHHPCWKEIYRDKVAVLIERAPATGSCQLAG